MKKQQTEKMRNEQGFIAALDQSGGSTPKALAAYGVKEDAYSSEDEMFELVHQMRTRIIKSPAFNSSRILGAILFEKTMDSKIDGKYTADFLWEEKNILPFLKVDKGLADEQNGVQLMKDMPQLEELLDRANERHIYGTKMRSVIKSCNEEGIKAIVAQQFEVGKRILAKGLMPIIEPEVDIHSADKEQSEDILKRELLKQLDTLEDGQEVMFKLSIPTKANLYKELVDHPKVLRVVALSGGYSREEANEKLSQNNGMIASFSRALVEGLTAGQSDAEFNEGLKEAIEGIYQASIK